MHAYMNTSCILVMYLLTSGAVHSCVVVEGVEKMATHVEAMTGYRVHRIWKVCWKIISPTLIIVSTGPVACLNSTIPLLL